MDNATPPTRMERISSKDKPLSDMISKKNLPSLIVTETPTNILSDI
jgi:hypothetical protein